MILKQYLCFLLSEWYFLVKTSKFVWINPSSLFFSFNHNMPLLSTITSRPFCISFFGNEIHFYVLKKRLHEFPLISLIILLVTIFSPSSYFNSSFLASLLTFHLSYIFFHFSYFCFSSTIVLNSLWLILRSINACNIKVSMLFNLLVATITILLCFFILFQYCFYYSCS